MSKKNYYTLIKVCPNKYTKRIIAIDVSTINKATISTLIKFVSKNCSVVHPESICSYHRSLRIKLHVCAFFSKSILH